MKRRFAAFAAACVMALSLAGCSGGNAPEPEDTSAYAAYALALAEYPVQAPYPIEDDYFENGEWDSERYNEDYDAWAADQHPDLELTEEERNVIPDFFGRTAPLLLPEGNEENFVYSPVNIWLAFSLLAEVTDGESRAQILNALGAEDIETLRAFAGDIRDDVYRDDGLAAAILADSLWLSDRAEYRQDTLDLLAERYYASAFSGTPGDPDYDAALQAWLNAQTRGLLEEQVSGVVMDPETILALASTIYYRTSWFDRFYEEANTEETFRAPGGDRTVTFMHRTDRMPYYEGEGFRAAGLSLRDGCTMWFFLPDEGRDARALLTDGSAAELLGSGALSDLVRFGASEEGSGRYAQLDLSVPRFDVSAELDLLPAMRELGVTDVLDPLVSDFTPLTDEDELAVSSAEHASRLMIDEEGVEAAAYTVMMVSGTGAFEEEEPIEFALDRPFVFADANRDGILLFAGLVNTVE